MSDVPPKGGHCTTDTTFAGADRTVEYTHRLPVVSVNEVSHTGKGFDWTTASSTVSLLRPVFARTDTQMTDPFDRRDR